MTTLEIILIAIGLAMDAFAVSICKGLSMKKIIIKNALITGLYFGLFQALMPLLGYFLGSQFASLIKEVDHWIAFVLLSILGVKMILDSREEEKLDSSFSFKTMSVLAIATSIDALAIGITLSFLKVSIVKAIIIIGFITFVICIVGVFIGNLVGSKFKSKAEILGGVILILMGLKILLEHLGVIGF